MSNLLGFKSFATREMLAEVETPLPTATWKPVPHIQVVEEVDRQLTQRGWRVREEQFGLCSKDNSKMFGVMTIENTADPEWTRAIGIRNSHDKSICVGICAGVSVLVCSNLCFNGERVSHRKHTSMLDVRAVVESGFYGLDKQFETLEAILSPMREHVITDVQAKDALVQCAEADAIPSCDIVSCYHEYKNPRHEEFNTSTEWALFNAITEISHKYSPARADWTHQKLTRLWGLDGAPRTLTAW